MEIRVKFHALRGDTSVLLSKRMTEQTCKYSDVFLVNFELEGKSYKAIVQDLQFHPVNDLIIHIDFLQVFDDKEVTANIPVKFKGTPTVYVRW